MALRRFHVWSLVGPFLWLCGAAARADPPPPETYRFTWVRGERTEGCSSGAGIAAAVAQRLGQEVFSESAQRSIEGVLQHEGDVWEVHLYVRDANGKLEGSRVLKTRGPTCAPIEAAATLAIALTFDLEAPPVASAATSPVPSSIPSVTPSVTPSVAPPLAKPAEPGAATPAIALPPVSPPRSPPPTPPTPAPLSGVAAFRAVVAAGLLPKLAPGLSFVGEVPVHRFLRLAGGLLYLPEQRTSDGGFAFGLTAAWLGACARPLDVPRASVSSCASAQVGAVHSVVLALEPLNPGDRFWIAASAEGALHLRIVGPVEAEVGIDLIVPFTRERFAVLERPGVVFQQSPADGVGFVGVGSLFP